ncbi:2Fe-2S iron-sulfur cluster-binding protein [Rapidithrix thailandica]|uniref:2Fe-2S iron-sulfur cluster-binding protein n=1 Tax=Rapidithrix thailandica TaxID=413964 RepID=A0AAW9SDG4_9BACT
MTDYYNLKVKSVVRETEDAVTIHFKQPLFRKVKYKPGQFLTLLVPVNGETLRRSYSMCSAPTLDSTVAVTIKRVEGGKVSNHLNDHAKSGDVIQVMKPMGHFGTEASKNKKRHIVLFGAGSGITPLMSILKSVLFYEPNSTVSLVYGNRNEQSIIFKEKLTEYKEKFGDRFNLVHVLSKPSENWGGYTGRIDETKVVNILNLLPKFSEEDTEYFLCGPHALMDMVETTLKKTKVPEFKIHHESFVSTKDPKKVAEELKSFKTHKVKILIDGEEHQLTVPPDKSILDVALDEGLDLPFSCQSGLCTACRGLCKEGKVKMVEGDGLSHDEIKEGYILTCVGHPQTEDVVIEIG